MCTFHNWNIKAERERAGKGRTVNGRTVKGRTVDERTGKGRAEKENSVPSHPKKRELGTPIFMFNINLI